MDLKEKIRGALFGAALGDALGIGTEFMTRSEVQTYYPEGLRHFDQIIRDAHRSQWKRGEWTNDTELLLLLIDSVIESKGINHLHYAKKMKEWFDSEPTDVVSLYRWLIPIEGWVENPVETTQKAWTSGLREASNEGLYRALITGLVSGKNLLEDTVNIISITHDDTRCTSTAVIIAKMVQSLLLLEKEAPYNELETISNNIDDRTTPYLHKSLHADIYDFDLDDEETLWYTRKAMGAALWSLWHCNSPEEVLYTVINAGGDADTNAVIAMFLAGLKYGYAALPKEVEKLVKYKTIEEYADKLYHFIDNNNRKNNPTFE